MFGIIRSLVYMWSALPRPTLLISCADSHLSYLHTLLSPPTDSDNPRTWTNKQFVLSEYQIVFQDLWLQMIGNIGSRATRWKNCNIWALLYMPFIRRRRVGWNWVIFGIFSYGWLHLWPWYCGSMPKHQHNVSTTTQGSRCLVNTVNWKGGSAYAKFVEM
jgi:hypothetical protein